MTAENAQLRARESANNFDGDKSKVLFSKILESCVHVADAFLLLDYVSEAENFQQGHFCEFAEWGEARASPSKSEQKVQPSGEDHPAIEDTFQSSMYTN